MARRRRKKPKRRRPQRRIQTSKRELLRQEPLRYYVFKGPKRYRGVIYDPIREQHYKRKRERRRIDRFLIRKREAFRRRITPDKYARIKEIRNFIQSRRKWICTKRRSRREGLFGSGNIGKNIVVSKLRRMTIDSMVDCRRT